MIGFIIGFVLGGWFGMCLLCVVQMAGDGKAGHIIKADETEIGAYALPNRKKPCLCIKKGNSCVVYGYFNNASSAALFMKELATAIGAKCEEGGKDGRDL